MKNFRVILAATIIGATFLPTVTMAAGNNASDAKRAEAANLPICSSKTASDCHIHNRETYLQVRPNRPNETVQPHAWWEYDRQQQESRALSQE